jgi:hypothetical protein
MKKTCPLARFSIVPTQRREEEKGRVDEINNRGN